MLPGRKGCSGQPAKNNRLFVEAVLYRYRAGFHGEIYRKDLVHGKTFTGDGVVGQKTGFGEKFSNNSREKQITNTA